MRLDEIEYPDLNLYNKEIEEARNEAFGLRTEVDLLRKFGQMPETAVKEDELQESLLRYQHLLNMRYELINNWIDEMLITIRTGREEPK